MAIESLEEAETGRKTREQELEEALMQYANKENWIEDDFLCLRIWAPVEADEVEAGCTLARKVLNLPAE